MVGAQMLQIAAGALYALLGASHTGIALRDLIRPQKLTPSDGNVRRAMQSADVAIAPGTNLWRAWMGFNLTHCIGLLLFGGILVYLGLNLGEAGYVFGLAAATLVAAAYFVISWRLFFALPTLVSAAALVAILVSWAFA